MKNYVYKFWAVACALVLGGWSIANATPVDTLVVSDGTDSISLSVSGSPVVSGSATPSTYSTSAGSVTWQGTIGSVWNVTLSDVKETGTATGITQPQLGLTFSEISSGSGTLTISWTAVGFGPSTGAFAAGINGTLDQATSLAYSTFYSTANAVPALTALTSPLAYSSPIGFNESDSAAIGAIGSPFSLTQVITITSTGTAHDVSSGTATLTSVPDAGNTLILLGVAISALGVFAGFNRRQWNRQWSR